MRVIHFFITFAAIYTYCDSDKARNNGLYQVQGG